MAYLSFRNSSTSQTEAQTTRQNLVLGRPLTYVEVDANFVAVNKDLTDLTNVYGVGAAKAVGLSVSDIYGSNDANNINKTGFYSLLSNASNVPSTVTAADAIVHVEASTQSEVDELGAFQITSDSNHLWHRTRRGLTSWDDWERLVNKKDLDAHMTSSSALINEKVNKSGDEMIGDLTFKNSKSVYFVNSEAVKDYGINAADHSVGVEFYDKNGFDHNINRLGRVYNRFWIDSNNCVNDVVLSANNPLAITEESKSLLGVGWRRKTIDGSSQYIEYAFAPHPTDWKTDDSDNGKQIATIGWTADYVKNQLNLTFDPNEYLSVHGGQVKGTVEVANDLVVEQNLSVESEAVVGYLEAAEGISSYSPIIISTPDYTHSSNPSSTYVTGYGFVADLDEESDVEPAFMDNGYHGGVMNTVDVTGTNSVGIYAKQWNKSDAVGTVAHGISISVDSTGKVTTHAPTPSSNSIGNEIITAEWVKQNLSTLDFGTM